jgi:hypothetical protein
VTGPASIEPASAAEPASRETRPAASPSRLGTALDLVPLGLAIVAEAAWISVAGGIIAEFTLQEPSLGIGVLALFVLAGVLAGHFLAPAAGDHWPSVALFLVAVGGLVGWLSSPVALATLETQGVFPALAVNVAGWVGALAVLRGYAHAKLPVSAGTLGTVFAVGVPCLAIAALAGGMIAEPHRARFLADATVAVVVFAGSVVVALAIARLTAVGAGSGFDWRRNPTWVALLVVLVLTTLAVAVPSSIASPLIALVAGSAVGPLLVIGLVLGFNKQAARNIAIVVAGVVLLFGIIRLLTGFGTPLKISLGGATGGEPVATDPGPVVQVGLLVVVIVAMILVLVLARLWSRRSGPTTDDLDEVRSIDRGDDSDALRPPRWRLGLGLRSGPEPADAVDAYLRLLRDLEARPTVRREPAETPAAHAARLRTEGAADLSLDLLAADYALARFGGVELSSAEQQRAIGRWRRLRRSLGSVTRPRSSEAPGG